MVRLESKDITLIVQSVLPKNTLKFSALFRWPDGLDLTQIKLSGSSLPGTNNAPDGILWSPVLSQNNEDNLDQFVRVFLYFYPFQKTKVW